MLVFFNQKFGKKCAFFAVFRQCYFCMTRGKPGKFRKFRPFVKNEFNVFHLLILNQKYTYIPEIMKHKLRKLCRLPKLLFEGAIRHFCDVITIMQLKNL